MAAQQAKQVLTQKIREAEREQVVEEYKDREGEMLSGLVKRVDRNGVYIDLGGNAEAFISQRNMVPGESVRPGDRLRAYLYEVRGEPRGPQLFASRTIVEFLVALFELEVPEIGQELGVAMFETGQKVDVRGVTKGRGFSGAIRRHNFRSQDSTHGNSVSHRAPGSIGQCQTPGRVFKGKRMAGQLGNVNRCQQNLEIVRVDSERNLILVSGSIPGAKGADVVIQPAVKARAEAAEA